MINSDLILNIHVIERERENRQCTKLAKLTDTDHRFSHPKLSRRCVLRRSRMNQELLQDGHLSVVFVHMKSFEQLSHDISRNKTYTSTRYDLMI